MGATQNNKPERKKRRTKTSRRTKVEADWSTVNAEYIYYLVKTVQGFDGAVRFGRSRDGSQYAVGVYGDGKPWTEYLDGGKDCNQWLDSIIADLSEDE